MSQVDFLLIRLFADLLVNTYTTFKFLRGKEVNRRKYEEESNHCGRDATAMEMTDVLVDDETIITDKSPLTP